MPISKFTLSALGLILTLYFTACKKENEENLINRNGGPPACDTTDVKYTADVLPIIQANCYTCHGNGQTEGGVDLSSYNNVKSFVNSNVLINVIMHTPGYPAMPQGLPQLSSCNINIIRSWINHGAPNN